MVNYSYRGFWLVLNLLVATQLTTLVLQNWPFVQMNRPNRGARGACQVCRLELGRWPLLGCLPSNHI